MNVWRMPNVLPPPTERRVEWIVTFLTPCVSMTVPMTTKRKKRMRIGSSAIGADALTPPRPK